MSDKRKKRSFSRVRRAKAITPAQQEALLLLDEGQNPDPKLRHYLNLADIALKNTTSLKIEKPGS